MFLRRLDERQQLEEKKANLIGTEVENPIYKPEYQKLRWNSFKDEDPEAMFALFTQPQKDMDDLTAFELMKQLGTEAGVFAQYMKGATFMVPTPRLLDQVVEMINAISMDDRDTKGDLYEYLLSKIATAGTNGQFRTPRHIIRMMVEMTQPTRDDAICDPSCGTAGFLVAASEYIHEHHDDWFNDKTFRDHYNSDMFTGIEFDSTILFDSDDIGSKQDYINHYGDKPLGEFIRSIVGMDIKAANEAFSDFIQSGNLRADQMTFINSIIDYLNKNGVIDKKMLFEPPFTHQHDQGLLGLFNDSEASKVIYLIDQVNGNAVASAAAG